MDRRESALWTAVCLSVACTWIATPSSVAEEPGEDTRPSFMIREAIGEAQRTRQAPSTGDVVMMAVPLRNLLGQAHGLHPRDVRSSREIDLAKRYDVLLRPPSVGDRAQARALLAAGIARSLNLTVERSTRTVPVNRLRLRAGEPALEPSQASRPEIDTAQGRFGGRGIHITELANFLRWRSPRPIIDETGLEATYDFMLEWDPSAGAGAMFLSLHDLGLEIVPGRGEFFFLMTSPST